MLPLLVEAAPRAFIRAVRQLVGDRGDALRVLLAEPSSLRGLLWGLEDLAWSPEFSDDAVRLLAELAEVSPKEGTGPFHSLVSVLSPWYPQTSVDHQGQLRTIDMLRKYRPTVAWPLMVALIPKIHQVSTPNYEPQYRQWQKRDARGTMTIPPSYVVSMVNRLIEDAESDATRWRDLLSLADKLPSPERKRIAGACNGVVANFGETDKEMLWNTLRERTVQHREFLNAPWALPDGELSDLDTLMEKLGSMELGTPMHWLFDEHRPAIPNVARSNIRDGSYDQVLTVKRVETVRAVVESGGWGALKKFVDEVQLPSYIGEALSDSGIDEFDSEIVRHLTSDDPKFVQFARAYMAKRFSDMGWEWWRQVRRELLTVEQQAQSLLLFRDFPSSWQEAELLGSDVRERFWQGFSILGLGRNFAHLEKVCVELRSVGRLSAVLGLLSLYHRDSAEDYSELIASALEELLQSSDPEIWGLEPYQFLDLFQYLNKRATIGWERVARLEWSYFQLLDTEFPQLHLHKLLSADSAFFLTLLRALIGKGDRDTEVKTSVKFGNRAYKLLMGWQTPPGVAPDGQFDRATFENWWGQVHENLGDVDAGFAEEFIGRALSYVPINGTEPWPPHTVREILEEHWSPALESGLSAGRLSQDGVTVRGVEDGAKRERELSASNMQEAANCEGTWPRTAAVLRSIARDYQRAGLSHEQISEFWRQGFGR